ncbi:MAG TPA: ABC transporter permease, partial [Symbiobacteriaceae bacterium]|nr:ABC transporter permease [Symbiobacteriaceae bacterium]
RIGQGNVSGFTVIVVNQDTEATLPLPPGMPAAMAGQPPTMNLGRILAEDVFASDQLKELITLKTTADLEAARATVVDGKAAAVVHVPSTFSADVLAGRKSAIEVIADPARATHADIVEQIVLSFTEEVTASGLVGRTLGAAQAMEMITAGMNRSVLPKVVSASAGAKQVDAIQYYAAAMAVMFMVMTAFARAKDVLTERADGTLPRMMMSPTARATVVAGQVLGNVLVVMAQFIILMIGTRLIFGVHWGPWGAALLLGAAFALAAAGIGTAAAGLLNDPRAADGAIGSVGVLFGALSGGMFPLYNFPDSMLLMAKFVPNYWGLQGFLDQMSGLGADYLWLPLTVLTAIGLSTGTVGAWRLASK